MKISMKEWPFVKIADLIENKEAELQTGPFGTQLKASDYVDQGTPLINVRNIGYGEFQTEKLEFLDDKMVDKLNMHIMEKGDIVFGRKGAVDRHGFIDKNTEGWIQGSDCLRLRLKSKKIYNKYLSYYFKTQSHKNWMEAVCSFGATMTSLNQDIVKRISIPLPPFPIQKKITGVLSAYDYLIENNNRRIAILEKMAEEIYQEWFVRMRFPGHEKVKFAKGVPGGWEIVRLGRIIELQYGKALKQEDRKDGKIPVYGSSGVVGYHDKFLVKGPGIIVGRKGNIGSIHWSDDNFYPIDTVYYVKSSLDLNFLFFLLQHMNFINNDAAVPGLNRNQAYSNELLLPPMTLINKFIEKTKGLFQLKSKLVSKTTILASRELLLSRLISGKLSVEDLDIWFPKSMEGNGA